MLTPDIVEILKELIIKLKLEDWTINLTSIEPNSICQIVNNKSNYINNSYKAITYVLPVSKIAEIYILNNADNIRELLIHELCHIKCSQPVYEAISNIENNLYLSPKEAQEAHQKLRNEEHKYIEEEIKKYK